MKRLGLFLLSVLLTGVRPIYAGPGDYYVIHVNNDPTNRIPKFGTSAFVRAPQFIVQTTADGPISQLGSFVNDPDAVIQIKHAVVADTDITAHTIVVETGASLTYPDQNQTTRFCQFIVEDGGKLTVGTAANRLQARVRFIIRAVPLNRDDQNLSDFDPNGFGRSMIFMGEVSMYGSLKTAYMRLSAAPRAGDASLQLLNPVSNWAPGDQVFIPDTRIMTYPGNLHGAGAILVRDHHESEVRTIASVSGANVTLTTPLQYDHLGSASGGTTYNGEPCNPHLANLTRNITVESENPSVIRGHTMATLRAYMLVDSVGFIGLGRTRAVRLNSTTFDANDDVLKLGTNQIGRYPFHWHMNAGPAVPRGPFQGSLENSVVYGSDKWLMAIHDSSYMRIRRCVGVEAAGGGMILEKGNEFYNVLEENFIAQVTGDESGANPEIRGDTEFSQGDGLGSVTPSFDSIGNIYAACHIGEGDYPGFTIGGESGSSRLPVRRPLFQGANIQMAGEYEEIIATWVLYGRHEGAEMYSMTHIGKGAWSNNEQGFELLPNGRVKNYVMWNLGGGLGLQSGAYFLDYSVYTVMGARLYDGVRVFFAHNPTGRESPEFNDMEMTNFKFGFTYDNRAPISHAAVVNNPTWQFNSCLFTDVLVGIEVHNNLQGPNPAGKIFTQLRNVRFVKDKAPSIVGVKFNMMDDPRLASSNQAQVIWTDYRTKAYDFNGIPGNNKDLFFQLSGPSNDLPKWCAQYPSFNGQFITECICPDTRSDGSHHTVGSCADEFSERSVPFRHKATCETTDSLVQDGYLCDMASGSNLPPTIQMPQGQIVTFPQAAHLTAQAADDGLPAPPQLTYSWKKVGGPGNVSFSNGTSLTTDATFSVPGNYTMRFIVSDGELSSAGDVNVVSSDPNGANLPPLADAGADQIITAPFQINLKGFVLDDGKPNPPAQVSTVWSQVSGPTGTNILDVNALQTGVTYSQTGRYVFRLTANDGLLGHSDDIVVTVNGTGGSAGGGGNPGGAGGVSPGKFRDVVMRNGNTGYFSYDVEGTSTQRVEIKILDMDGHEVASVEDAQRAPGAYVVAFDGMSKKGTKLASGTYLSRLLKNGKISARNKLVISR